MALKVEVCAEVGNRYMSPKPDKTHEPSVTVYKDTPQVGGEIGFKGPHLGLILACLDELRLAMVYCMPAILCQTLHGDFFNFSALFCYWLAILALVFAWSRLARR